MAAILGDIAAVAMVAVLITIAHVYSEVMTHALQQPGIEAALQTLITAVVVYAAPANK